MEKSTAACIGAVLLLCYTGLTRAYAGLCDQSQVKQEQTQCFTDLGISVAIFDLPAVRGNYTDVCSYQGVYKAAARCAFDVRQKCVSEMGEGNDILPEAEKVMQLLSWLCSHTEDHSFPALAPPMSIGPLFSVMPRHRRDACSQNSLRERQQECFSRENIPIVLPPADGSQGSKQSPLDFALSNENTMQALCRSGQVERYQRAVGCAVEIPRQCLPEEYLGYVLDANAAKSMISELCSHVYDINYSCLNQTKSALEDCVSRLGKTPTAFDIETLLCGAYRLTVVCLKEVLPPCGCKTTMLQVQITKQYLNAPACPPITESTPVCQAGTDRFVSGGGQSQFPSYPANQVEPDIRFVSLEGDQSQFPSYHVKQVGPVRFVPGSGPSQFPSYPAAALLLTSCLSVRLVI